jgi:hypothetical protein
LKYSFYPVGSPKTIRASKPTSFSWCEGRDSHPQIPPIRWKRKPLAALASMAVVKFQLQRLSRGRTTRPDVSALWALILDRLYIGKRTRQYLQAMGK